MLVAPSWETVAQAKASFPKNTPSGLTIRLVEHSEKELIGAKDRLWREQTELLPGIELCSAGIDTVGNGILAGVFAGQLSEATAMAASLGEQLGVPVSVREDELAESAVCTGRLNCHSPVRGGIRINRESIDDDFYCTMGFVVELSSGEKAATTAGHCVDVAPHTWFVPGYGLLRARYNSLLEDGTDAPLITMPQSQASNRVYANFSTNYLTMTGVAGIWYD